MNLNRKHTQPIPVARTGRLHQTRALTSLPAGKMVPLAAIPLLREDGVRQGKWRISFEMMETVEILMNAVNVRVMAYLVPTLALDRFQGSMDILNRSYNGQAAIDGGAVIPFIETAAFGTHGSNLVYKYMGMHAPSAQLVNTQYLETYNQIWNFRAKNRSMQIAARTRLQTDLAPAFWSHQAFEHIVPDFDQAVIDGQVALNVVDAKMPVKGIGISQQGTPMTNFSARESGMTVNTTYAKSWMVTNAVDGAAVADRTKLQIKQHAVQTAAPDIWAELQQNGITVSLSNIEMARKTQAFARLRQQFEGQPDSWIIDMLMDGLSIPDQALAQPMLLADVSTVFGMSKRYATDSGNLTESVVSGATYVDISVNLPRLSTGGVIMFVAEITPEQLFERQKDPYLLAQNVDALPAFLRDTLDPEKVSVVRNDQVDMSHATPAGTFGYAPLNYEWNITKPTIGGRFYRPTVDGAFDEDRQRIWAVETANPTLSTSFYLVNNIHTKPFAVTNQDPFEMVMVGGAVIEGNTVFGGALIEAGGNYAAVLAEAPQGRIAK